MAVAAVVAESSSRVVAVVAVKSRQQVPTTTAFTSTAVGQTG